MRFLSRALFLMKIKRSFLGAHIAYRDADPKNSIISFNNDHLLLRTKNSFPLIIRFERFCFHIVQN